MRRKSFWLCIAALWLLTVAAGGCSQSAVSTSPSGFAPTAGQSPSAAVSASPTVTLPATSASSVEASDFVTGLNAPWEMVFLPDGRILVSERPGRIVIIKNGQLQPDPWIILKVATGGEDGLLGLALDPQFSANHQLYAAYTYQDSAGGLKNRLVRLREDPSTGKGAEDKILLDNAAGGGIHDGGRVKIGPDGKIYWTLGETGNTAFSQDPSSLNGKILRLNLDGSVPADNPFPGSYVYSLGHRNPEGLDWQPGSGRLYETEHGSSATDEVNYILPGGNYGWPILRGDAAQSGFVSPILQSGSETWAPSGATFVSGGPWAGSFLFAGLAGQALFRLRLDSAVPTKVVSFEKLLAGRYGRLRDVVQGPDGSLYLITNNTDGRGSPRAGDDRILKLTAK